MRTQSSKLSTLTICGLATAGLIGYLSLPLNALASEGSDSIAGAASSALGSFYSVPEQTDESSEPVTQSTASSSPNSFLDPFIGSWSLDTMVQSDGELLLENSADRDSAFSITIDLSTDKRFAMTVIDGGDPQVTIGKWRATGNNKGVLDSGDDKLIFSISDDQLVIEQNGIALSFKHTSHVSDVDERLRSQYTFINSWDYIGIIDDGSVAFIPAVLVGESGSLVISSDGGFVFTLQQESSESADEAHGTWEAVDSNHAILSSNGISLSVSGSDSQLRLEDEASILLFQTNGVPASSDTSDYSWVSYDELARNPENYLGEKIIKSGPVRQVFDNEDGTTTIMVATDEGYGDPIFVHFNSDALQSGRVLEGDFVYCYGLFMGLTTYESVGDGIRIEPQMFADSISR